MVTFFWWFIIIETIDFALIQSWIVIIYIWEKNDFKRIIITKVDNRNLLMFQTLNRQTGSHWFNETEPTSTNKCKWYVLYVWRERVIAPGLFTRFLK